MSDWFVRISVDIDTARQLFPQYALLNHGMTQVAVADEPHLMAFAALPQSQRLDVILSGMKLREPEVLRHE